jgi:uncharacterized protein (DUF1697 family)
MNLGRRRITNDELAACFVELGFTDVSPFLASGNVVFSATMEPRKLEARIEAGLGVALGYAVPTFVRTGDEVRAIAGREPFSAPMRAASSGKLQVMLLDGSPGAEARRVVEALSTGDDRLVVGDAEIYWLPIGNMSASELDIRAIEGAVGTITIRTQRTLERIAARLG